MTDRNEIRYKLQLPGWENVVSPDPGPETLLEVEVEAPLIRDMGRGREVNLYHWHPKSYNLTNETYYGRVGRFFDLSDAKRFLVEKLAGVILSEVAS